MMYKLLIYYEVTCKLNPILSMSCFTGYAVGMEMFLMLLSDRQVLVDLHLPLVNFYFQCVSQIFISSPSALREQNKALE